MKRWRRSNKKKEQQTNVSSKSNINRQISSWNNVLQKKEKQLGRKDREISLRWRRTRQPKSRE